MSRPNSIRISNARYYRRWTDKTKGNEALGFWNQTNEVTYAVTLREPGENSVEFLKRFFKNVREFLIDDLRIKPLTSIEEEDFINAVESGYNAALTKLAEEFGLEI